MFLFYILQKNVTVINTTCFPKTLSHQISGFHVASNSAVRAVPVGRKQESMVARPACFMRSYRVHIIVNRNVDRNDALYGLVPGSEARTFFVTLCNSPVTLQILFLLFQRTCTCT